MTESITTPLPYYGTCTTCGTRKAAATGDKCPDCGEALQDIRYGYCPKCENGVNATEENTCCLCGNPVNVELPTREDFERAPAIAAMRRARTLPDGSHRPRCSKYRGLSFNVRKRLWRAYLSAYGRDHSLGSSPDESTAARYYDNAVHHAEKAGVLPRARVINFPAEYPANGPVPPPTGNTCFLITRLARLKAEAEAKDKPL